MFKVNKIHVHQRYYDPFCPRNVWMVDDWWTGWEHDRVITDYIHVSCFAPTRAIYRPGLSVFYIVSLYLIVCHLSCIETDVMSYHDILTSITVNLHLVTFQHSHRCRRTAIVQHYSLTFEYGHFASKFWRNHSYLPYGVITIDEDIAHPKLIQSICYINFDF